MRIGLDIPPGIVSDDTTFSSSGRYEDGSNFRFWRGKPQAIGGWLALTPSLLTGVCRTAFAWADNSAQQNIAFGTHSALMVHVGGALFNITPAGLLAGAVDGVGGPGYGGETYDTGSYGTIRTNFYPRTWSLSTYGQSLIANPRLGGIYQWTNSTGAAAAPVANAPAKVAFALVTPERQLIAFGCNEEVSGTFNPLCIRWSDIENITVWTTAANNNAGEHILEGGGRIVAARLFGSGMAVWTDNAAYYGQFVGDPGQTFRFDRVEENCGLIGPNAVTIVNQTAYWIGPDLQFRFWTLGGTPEIIACPIRSDFADNLAQAQGDKIVAASVSKFAEVWWHYPDARDGSENSRYVAMSAKDGTWFKGKLPRSAAIDAGIVGYPVMVAPTGEIYHHELGKNANGAPLEAYIKTADQYLDEAGRAMMIRGIYPDFEDQAGTVSLTVHMRRHPQGTITTKGPYPLAAGAGKKDFRVSGVVFSMTFSLASNPAYARLGKPVLDLRPCGRR
jgi:hypothetical protein